MGGIKFSPVAIKFSSPFRAALAAMRVLWWKILRRRLFTTEQEELDRLAECQNCENYLPDTEQCAVCTCWIPAKVKLASEQCPKRKWLRLKAKPITFTCHVE